MPKEKEFNIIINGRPKTVTDKKISFIDIITLAYGSFNQSEDIAYTVAYTNNKHRDGALVYNESLRIHEGVIFNVTKTNRS
jgi:hypothetical protein